MTLERPDKESNVEKDKKTKLINRLSRIEGQVRGVARMIDSERYCIDVLTQIQAIRSAMARVETEMLKDHLANCIESTMVAGDSVQQRAKAGELIELLERSVR